MLNDWFLLIFGPAVLVAAIGLALWRNAQERRVRQQQMALYQAQNTSAEARLDQSLAHQQQMIALLEEANATLRQIAEQTRR